MAPHVKMSAHKAKGKSPYVPSSSQDPESEKEGNEQLEEVEEKMVEPPPTRRRKRSSEEVSSARQKKWEDRMAKRNVKNERHVDAASFGAQHRAI
ncbi:hypothetical protein RHSIM_Rhsim10G0204500 [Rhododendron simsii]|uniref:Uncharacterized protein n=1 Tax=Rhododendron simsii TaxID=118357 RepID=A0A834GBJ5_RHOSS|nr:hypothetical protein RHSIM_Rhsim10G0204500 [Rhododendron simsii]